jgi:hypothetical protein
MGVRDLLHRLRTPVHEHDEERLRAFCAAYADAVPIGDVLPRQQVTIVGEVASVRIVPRAATAWLEVTLTDGSDRAVAMWTGRRRVAGVTPGRRMMVSGRALPSGPGGRMVLLNPLYELL